MVLWIQKEQDSGRPSVFGVMLIFGTMNSQALHFPEVFLCQRLVRVAKSTGP